MLNRLSYYFRDSYGVDKLTKYLLVAGLLLSLTKYTSIVGIIFVFYGLFRTLSKNKYRRYQELSVFENNLLILKQRYYRLKTYIKDLPKYKIFKCPNCSQKLRVPRKKGRIIITCKKCGTEFKGKS